MKKLFLGVIVTSLVFACSSTQQKSNFQTKKEVIFSAQADTIVPIKKSEEEWKSELTPEQFWVLREQGTERPFTGKWLANKQDGQYVCAACGFPLFSSDAKYETECGWPSFYESLDKSHVIEIVDNSHGMHRIEIRCARCGGHLGHIFNDGPRPTGMRYCINSVSLDFVPKQDTTKIKNN